MKTIEKFRDFFSTNSGFCPIFLRPMLKLSVYVTPSVKTPFFSFSSVSEKFWEIACSLDLADFIEVTDTIRFKMVMQHANKTRSRAAISSVKVAHDNLIEHTTNYFYKNPILTIEHLNGYLVGRSQAGSFREI